MAAKECTFCRIARGELDAHVVHADEAHLAFLDHRPLFPGHVLVVPRPHVETLLDLPAERVGPLFLLVQRISRAVEQGLGADGFFNAVNNRISQSVPHLHVHVIPRRKKDGLKGFFWPRYSYSGEDEMTRVREAIVAALAMLAMLVLGCGKTPAAPGGVADAGPDGAGPASCAPLDVAPFDPATSGTFAGKAGAPCTRDIDCADGTFCYVVKGTCAPASIIQGPGKGGHLANGDACVAAPAFPATCDALSLSWSTPVAVSKSAASLGESDTALLADGKGNVLIAWAANATGVSQKNGLARSSDGGKSFQTVTAPVHAAAEEENDAALAVDGAGLYYYVWEGYGAEFQGAQHVYASTSTDGLTWSPALQIDTPGDNGNDTIPLDFPAVAINPVSDQPYFTYQVTSSSGPVPLRLVVGAKGGASVSPSVELDDGQRPSSYRDLARGAFDAKGSFYASWIELAGSGGSTGQGLESGDTGNAVYFTRVDLGAGGGLAPLGHDVLVSGKGEALVFGLPELHVTGDGASAFVVYEVGTKNAVDVRVAVSHDRGLTWGASVKVNDDATCATHYRAAAALDAKGRLWVLWYDNRDGAGHVVYSVTDDGGQTFHPNRPVTPVAFPFETFQYSVGWLGDYFQVVTTGEEILAAWSDPHDGDQSHVNFARATLP